MGERKKREKEGEEEEKDLSQGIGACNYKG